MISFLQEIGKPTGWGGVPPHEVSFRIPEVCFSRLVSLRIVFLCFVFAFGLVLMFTFVILGLSVSCLFCFLIPACMKYYLFKVYTKIHN